MTFKKVASFLSEQLGVDEDSIKMDSKIIDDLKADSLDVVELLMTLEDEFDIVVSEEEASNLQTVGDIVKLIDNN
ncbi:MAG: acyl carrier protein [Clostridia bacterium]|nr:acyl carrier protein [Clostridia bacterium]